MAQIQRRPQARSVPALRASQIGPLLPRAVFPQSSVPAVHAPEPVHWPLRWLQSRSGQARVLWSLAQQGLQRRRYTKPEASAEQVVPEVSLLQESVCPELLGPVWLSLQPQATPEVLLVSLQVLAAA